MGEKGAVVVAIAVGYVLVPPLARAWPPLVNGFLFLILFGSLLNRKDVWLPYLEGLSKTTSSGTGSKAKAQTGRVSGGSWVPAVDRRLPELRPS